MNTPVAMPDPYGYTYEEWKEQVREYQAQQGVNRDYDFTLEDYFKNLQKICNDLDQESTVKLSQVGGDHYQKAALQPWDIFLAWGLDPWAANVVKYILRFPHKNGLEDLKKAKHYVDFLIEHYDEVSEKYYSKD